jgi:hypothetical protein
MIFIFGRIRILKEFLKYENADAGILSSANSKDNSVKFNPEQNLVIETNNNILYSNCKRRKIKVLGYNLTLPSNFKNYSLNKQNLMIIYYIINLTTTFTNLTTLPAVKPKSIYNITVTMLIYIK